jgi:hypothetical protein
VSRPTDHRFRLTPDGTEPRTLEEPQTLPLPLLRYLSSAAVALARSLPLLPLRLMIGLLSPDSLIFVGAVAAAATAADRYGLLRPALATLEQQAQSGPTPLVAGLLLGLAVATILRGLLEALLTELLRSRVAGRTLPPTAPLIARWATHSGLSLVQLAVFAGTLTAFAPLFATSLQRMDAGGDDPKVRQLTAAAVTIVVIVQALSQFLVGQGRALVAWRHTFFPGAVAQMFSSPWREGRIYGKLLLWLLVGRPLLAQAGAVLLFFAVQLWVTAVPLQVAGAWLVVAVVALAGSALALWFDLLLLGLSGHLRGHLVWAQTRLEAAEAASTEPLFAPPQVGWFIPEPNAAELHRFGYDQILLKRVEPPPLPPAQHPEETSNEMPEATLAQPEAALSHVEPVERPPQPEPRRLADLAPAATVWRAPSGVREQRWEPPTGR